MALSAVERFHVDGRQKTFSCLHFYYQAAIDRTRNLCSAQKQIEWAVDKTKWHPRFESSHSTDRHLTSHEDCKKESSEINEMKIIFRNMKHKANMKSIKPRCILINNCKAHKARSSASEWQTKLKFFCFISLKVKKNAFVVSCTAVELEYRWMKVYIKTKADCRASTQPHPRSFNFNSL